MRSRSRNGGKAEAMEKRSREGGDTWQPPRSRVTDDPSGPCWAHRLTKAQWESSIHRKHWLLQNSGIDLISSLTKRGRKKEENF